MYYSDFEADAPRRRAAQEWQDWVAHTSSFIPSTYKGLPGDSLGIATSEFTPESGLIRNSEWTSWTLFPLSLNFFGIIDSYESQLRKQQEGARGKKRSNKAKSKSRPRSEYYCVLCPLFVAHI